MNALTSFVLRHRRLVGLAWLVLLAIGGAASASLSGHVSQSFEVPGAPSAAAARAIVGQYRSGGSESPLIPVVRVPAARTVYQPQVIADLRAGLAALAAAGPGGSRVASYASTVSWSFVLGLTILTTAFPPTRDDRRHLRRARQAGCRDGADRRRHGHPGNQLALDLLDQRADRSRRPATRDATAGT